MPAPGSAPGPPRRRRSARASGCRRPTNPPRSTRDGASFPPYQRDCTVPTLSGVNLLARRRHELAVVELLDVLGAPELQQLHVPLDPTVERHRDLPRPREHVRVLDG